jgi:hypothetical protein
MNAELINNSIETAKSAIDALKQNPVILALVILQFFIIGGVLYSSLDRQKANTDELTRLHKTLDDCVAGHITNLK